MSRLIFNLITVFVSLFASPGSTLDLNKPLVESWDDHSNYQKIRSFYGEPDFTKPAFDWESIVLMMNIYDSSEMNEMVKDHFSFWLRDVGLGADMIFITDHDDLRPDDDILETLSGGTDEIAANLHVLRSPFDKKGGKDVRNKIIDGFREVEDLFKSSEVEKLYYIKIDPGSYLKPRDLLPYLNYLHKQTYPKPVHFGYAKCYRVPCYAEGGFYGFNNVGFSALNQYFKNHHGLVTVDQYYLQGREREFMDHEDFMVSFAFKKATQTPLIHNPLIFVYKSNWRSVGTVFKTSFELRQVLHAIYDDEYDMKVKNPMFDLLREDG